MINFYKKCTVFSFFKSNATCTPTPYEDFSKSNLRVLLYSKSQSQLWQYLGYGYNFSFILMSDKLIASETFGQRCLVTGGWWLGKIILRF